MDEPCTKVANRRNAVATKRKPAKKTVNRQLSTIDKALLDTGTIGASVIEAATEAGGGSLVAYLRQQAQERPSAFVPLLGKVLSMQNSGAKGGSVNLDFTVRFVTNDIGKAQSRTESGRRDNEGPA